MNKKTIFVGGISVLLSACAPTVLDAQNVQDEQAEIIIAQNNSQSNQASQNNAEPLTANDVPLKYKRAGLTELWLADQERKKREPATGWNNANTWSSVDQELELRASAMLTNHRWRFIEAVDYKIKLPNDFYFDAFLKNIDKSSERGDYQDLRINELDFGFGFSKFLNIDDYILRFNINYERADVNQVSGGNFPDRIVVPMIDFGFGIRNPKTGLTATISYTPFVDGSYDMNGYDQDVDGYRLKTLVELNNPNSDWLFGLEYKRTLKEYEGAFDVLDNTIIPYFGTEGIPGLEKLSVGFPISMSEHSEEGFNARFAVQAKARYRPRSHSNMYLDASVLIREASESNKEAGENIETGFTVGVGVKF